MEANQTPSIPPLESSAPPAVPPVAPAVQPIQKPPGGGPNKLLLLLLGILFIVFIGLLFYFITQVMSPKTSSESTQVYPTPITQISPSVSPTPSLETDEDVEAIEIGSPEGDLVDINADLNSL